MKTETSDQIIQKYCQKKDRMTMEQLDIITTLADNLGMYGKYLTKLGIVGEIKHRQRNVLQPDHTYKVVLTPYIDISIGKLFSVTFDQAQSIIDELCEMIDHDPNDPESWDCSEEEYEDRMSNLCNSAHEASEGDR